MTITITVDAVDGAAARHELAQLLNVQLIDSTAAGRIATDMPMFAPPGAHTLRFAPEADLPLEAQEAKVFTQPAHDQNVAQTPKRERGKAAPGRARRTKEEIAEDTAADAADAALRAAGEETGAIVPDKHVDEVPNITASPEDRQDPANPDPVDDEETAQQDAADEAAETAAARGDNPALTLDDVRNALKGYVTKYGIDAAQADGPKLIARVLGVAHDDAAPKKISDLGDDQALMKRAIDGVGEMLAKNPFGRQEKAAA